MKLIVLPALLFVFSIVVSACNGSGIFDSDSFAVDLAALEQQTGGIIGVYALDTANGRTVGHRADQRFAMASTFKPLLVAAVLARVDIAELTLDDTFAVDPDKIVTYSPVVGKVEPGQRISLHALCEAAMTISDNTAANMLLELVDGPAGLTQFLRQQDDDITRLDRNEVELNTNLRDDKRDTTTPRAMVNTLNNIVLGNVLSKNSTVQLQNWLIASRTGGKRLRAGLPTTWRTGDKTGTGSNGAANNIAITWPPERPAIIIAVYMSWSEAETSSLNAVHAEIAALVASAFFD